VPHVAHPAGATPEDAGTNAWEVIGSTATECALLPVFSCVTSAWLDASMMESTGVQGDAALHAPSVPALPLAVQRLPAV
jgi:hypothetical protein